MAHSVDKIDVIRTKCKESFSFNFTISPTVINLTMLKSAYCCARVCDFRRQFFIYEWKKSNPEKTQRHMALQNTICTCNRPSTNGLSSSGSHTDFICVFSLLKSHRKKWKMKNTENNKQNK